MFRLFSNLTLAPAPAPSVGLTKSLRSEHGAPEPESSLGDSHSVGSGLSRHQIATDKTGIIINLFTVFW